ncbi:FtsX-like permease family protein [Spirosoma sp. HMF4905]|uniref:FtsX-like permease family protein n=1 Tax=Spirosoma arboris TaxID=2682092 RepID=A0A7K1SJ51_9BACT|nr:ABC transporter permease [Spirosoma arboris]MVM33795.1 FtsX-like permease family protein [Spirosoma arboris]
MTPPRLADRLLNWFCAPHLREEVLGDLHERYALRVAKYGETNARRRYWREVLAYVRPSMIKRTPSQYPTTFFLSPDMLRNYLKIALRNLVKNKVYSFINIGGLAVGMAVAMLIGLWVYDEISFDKSFPNYDRIAQVMQNQTFDGEVQTWSNVAMPLGPELRTTYGNNFTYVVRAGWIGDHLLSLGEKKLTKGGNYMEAEAPDMLSLTMLKGSLSGLQDINSILLSKSVAKAFFGNADPLNKIIRLDNKLDVKITGVYEDLPTNSSFANLSFIAPWELMVKSQGLEQILQNPWGASWFQTFAQVADKADMNTVSALIKHAKRNRVGKEGARNNPEIFLQPMRNWHLYSEFKNGITSGGRIQYVWLFGIIGLFVLLLACINFMNLSTARSEKRAKEVGIRKAVGSVRSQLVSQFFSESLLVVIIAFLLSLLLVQLILPVFNEVADKQMAILWETPAFWLIGVGFSLLTGLIAGSYPALYLSSFQPVKVLKGRFRVGRFAAVPRKLLVVVQFTVSVTLIIGTLIVFRQIQYAKNRPIGYNRSSLLTINAGDIRNHFQAFRDDLLETGAVLNVAESETQITNTYLTNSGLSWKGKDPAMQEEFVTLGVTQDFGKTVDWKIKEGRDFSTDFASDSSGVIVNEAAVNYMGMKQPIGETIKWGDKLVHVVGVVKNMVTQNPYDPIKQTFFYLRKGDLNTIILKINPNTPSSDAIGTIERVFKKYNSAIPFEYRFIDDEYAKKFGDEERIGKLASFFAVLAIFISCLGIFGLASFIAEQRTKEIGVRKVLGASVLNLWGLLSKDFVILVIIAFGIATPIAYYFLNNWLQKYDYRTELSWWIFAVSGAGALAITLLTVSFQSVKAALMNPVRSLRSE